MLRVAEAWSSADYPEIVLFARGKVGPREGEHVAGAIGRMLARYRITGGARLRVTTAEGANGPMLVQANLRISGVASRIQTLTTGSHDIAPALGRLERQIVSATAPWRPRPWPDNRPAPAAFGAGNILRRKLVRLVTQTPLEAIQVMDAMDYDVHLFLDADTGEEAIVYRAGPTGLKLARRHSARPPQIVSVAAPLTVNPRTTPVLTETEAAQRLRDHGLPFLFFTDHDTRRGHLLYRRYDAGLALLGPAEQ